ncbi:helix-turn-helix domain-containing protein [uncultured Paludibaculum sp.]|uniref:helix-turn-helix domain-containing protein n=1 Tax=uncultured Paludibaculum sp. TaxID=1765020 RepID=UPI002AAB3918|nr:helix-turn-helix domain-containing protein [uncultured Paludibaculum sp.]
MMKAIADAVVARLEPLLVDRALQPRLLTVKQAAAYLARTEKATYQLIAIGSLPSVRSDARVMLDRQDLDRWIEGNKA